MHKCAFMVGYEKSFWWLFVIKIKLKGKVYDPQIMFCHNEFGPRSETSNYSQLGANDNLFYAKLKRLVYLSTGQTINVFVCFMFSIYVRKAKVHPSTKHLEDRPPSDSITKASTKALKKLFSI